MNDMIQALRDAPGEMLTPAQVAPVLGCDQQDIRVAARLRPDRLGFNICIIGSRVKIPKRAFLRWIEGTNGHEEQIPHSDRQHWQHV